MKSIIAFLRQIFTPKKEHIQNPPVQPLIVVDYEGGELSEAGIKALQEREERELELAVKVKNTLVYKANSYEEFLVVFEKDGKPVNRFQNISLFNIENKLIKPYRFGEISGRQLMNVLDTLSPQLKQQVPLYFSKYYIPQLNTDKELLEYIYEIDRTLDNGRNRFKINCTQRHPGFEKEIERKFSSAEFHSERSPEYGFFLSRYTITGDHQKILNLLKIVIDNLKVNRSIDSPSGDFLSAFEYLILYGTDKVKSQARKLLFQYMEQAPPSTIIYERKLINNEISKDFRNLIQCKLNQIEKISDPEKKDKARKSFNDYYLADYARNFGYEALAYIAPFLQIPDEYKKFNDDQINYRITEYKLIVQARSGLAAINELVQYNDLGKKEKQAVLDLLVKADFQHADAYLWQYYISILKKIYPSKNIGDFDSIFQHVDLRGSSQTLEAYWEIENQKRGELDSYLEYLEKIGFPLKTITPEERLTFNYKSQGYKEDLYLKVILELVEVALNYDCETGIWPNPYDELLEDYLNICKEDLKGFHALYSFNKLNDDYETEYTAGITNGKIGYYASPEDFGDWYDPHSVEAILNTALKDANVPRRFIQIESGDQTVISVYCEPGQLKLLADRFGLRILNTTE